MWQDLSFPSRVVGRWDISQRDINLRMYLSMNEMSSLLFALSTVCFSPYPVSYNSILIPSHFTSSFYLI